MSTDRPSPCANERSISEARHLLLAPQVWLINLSSSSHQLLLRRREQCTRERRVELLSVTETGFAPVTHGKMRLSRVSQMRVHEGNLPKHLASSFHG